jgi:hypothetical protein
MRNGMLLGLAAVLVGCSADPGDGASTSTSEALGTTFMVLQGLTFPITAESFYSARHVEITAPDGSWRTTVVRDEERGVVVPTVEIVSTTEKIVLTDVVFSSVAVAPNGTVVMKMLYTTVRVSQ